MRRFAITCALLGAGCLERPVRAMPDASIVAPELTSFGFRMGNNPDLVADVTATIDGQQIRATMPIDTSAGALVAVFETTSGTVTVDGAEQVSGETPNNFTGPRTYVVSTPDGRTKSYEVRLRLPGFHAQVSFGVGMQPASLAAGDIDGDGKVDLATTNYQANTFSILRNMTPTGGTTPVFGAVQLAAVQGPLGIAIADLSGDAKPEVIIVSATTNAVAVYPNQSTPGTMAFGAATNFPVGMTPYGVAVGDLDGNGSPDLVVSNCQSGTVSVLLANGPTFVPQPSQPTGACPIGVNVVDIDGDAVLDILASNTGGPSLSVLRNMGTGTFAPGITITTGTTPGSLGPADFDGDGLMDIAVNDVGSTNNPARTVTVLRNTGTRGQPAFMPATVLDTQDMSYFATASDLTGDGMPDILAANTASMAVGTTISIYLATKPKPEEPVGSLAFYPRKDIPTATGPTTIEIADLNGDARPDLAVVGRQASVVSVLLAR